MTASSELSLTPIGNRARLELTREGIEVGLTVGYDVPRFVSLFHLGRGTWEREADSGAAPVVGGAWGGIGCGAPPGAPPGAPAGWGCP